MSELYVAFGPQKPGVDAKEYLVKKIGAFGKATPQLALDGTELCSECDAEEVANEFLHSNLSTPRLVAASDFPKIGATRQKMADRLIAGAVEEINQRHPLISGETLEHDFGSYLADHWLHFAPGVGVIERRTSQATIYYIFPEVTVEGGHVQVAEKPVRNPPFPHMRALAVFPWGETARAIADGIAGLMPSPYNVIFSAFLPLFFHSVESLGWTSAHDGYREVVRQELDRVWLQEAEKKLNGIRLFMGSSYKYLRADCKRSRTELQNALEGYDRTFHQDVIAALMHSNVKISGLANFVIAAGVHLGFTQERALVDPHHIQNPHESPYAKTVQHLAKTYADHARSVVREIRAWRLGFITPVKDGESFRCRGNQICELFKYCWYDDTHNRWGGRFEETKNENHDQRHQRAEQHRNEYLTRVAQAFDTEFQTNVLNAVQSWEKLITNPLPIDRPIRCPDF